MKVLTTILCLTLIALSTSCGGDDSENTNNENSFFVKIDGVDYNPQFVNGFITTSDTNILISGSDSNGKNVTINFPITAVEGDTFTIQDLEFIASYDTSEGDASVAKSEGTVTITAHNTSKKSISGTFNFVTQPIVVSSGNSYVFTEGNFEVTYTDL